MEKRNDDKIIQISDSDSSDVIEVNEIKDETSCNNGEQDNQIEWNEESSESEPDLECDIWDDDCITIHAQQRKNAIIGYHLMPTCLQEHEVPPLKKQKLIDCPTLHANLIETDFMNLFKHHWNENMEFKTNEVELLIDPFKFCIVDDFVDNILVLDEIRKEFNEINWNKRSMDLYDFFQSEDLKQLTNKHTKQMHDFLKSDVKNWLEKITDLEFHNISATCSVYSDTDYLLIHDDLEKDRAIAFILYLTDPVPGSKKELWTSDMGGLLELFSRDEKGHPKVPVKQIVPKNNRFVFFKVSNVSFHQVTEVLNMDHCRISINGWFHTLKPDKYESPVLERPKTGLFGSVNLLPLNIDFPLNNWINSQYLKRVTKKQIQHHIENESEISLNNFFDAEMHEAVCEVLRNNDIIWDTIGPPNRRKYEIISNKIMPNIITEMLTMFQSKNMFSLLHEYTDLDLNIDFKNNVNPTVKFELQRWKPGSYSIFSEYEQDKENQLDLVMYLGNPEHLRIVGGQTMFVSTAETIEDALITLPPKSNNLNIVFHDTARIVKYVSKRSFDEYFYMLVCSYKEKNII